MTGRDTLTTCNARIQCLTKSRIQSNNSLFYRGNRASLNSFFAGHDQNSILKEIDWSIDWICVSEVGRFFFGGRGGEGGNCPGFECPTKKRSSMIYLGQLCGSNCARATGTLRDSPQMYPWRVCWSPWCMCKVVRLILHVHQVSSVFFFWSSLRGETSQATHNYFLFFYLLPARSTGCCRCGLFFFFNSQFVTMRRPIFLDAFKMVLVLFRFRFSRLREGEKWQS